MSLALAVASCASNKGESPVAAGGTGTAIGAGGSVSTYEPPKCGQGCQDYLVAWALDDTLWFLWNQRIAGRPSGTQDAMGACPLGGSVHITGTDSVASDGTTSTDIQFELVDCENSNKQYDLVFSGSVSMEGSFNGSTSFAAELFSVVGLDVKGTLHWLDDPAIDQACDVSFKQQGIGDGPGLNGRVCGRDFDESSIKASSSGGAGQAGATQGGSSNGSGGGASNCACTCPNGSDCTGAKTPNPCGNDADGIPNPCACPVECL